MAVERDVVFVASVGLHKLQALHKHAARAAGQIHDAAAQGLYHFYEQAHHRAGRKELPGTGALGLGKFADVVLVHAAVDIALGVVFFGELGLREQVDKPGHLGGRELAAHEYGLEYAFVVGVALGEQAVYFYKGFVYEYLNVVQVASRGSLYTLRTWYSSSSSSTWGCSASGRW